VISPRVLVSAAPGDPRAIAALRQIKRPYAPRQRRAREDNARPAMSTTSAAAFL
jgi:hypothetical protein